MTRYDAKVECVVNRPFLHYGIKYEKGDIFLINPNNLIHRAWLRTKKVYQLPEDKYEYICTRQSKEMLGKLYSFGDVVDLSEMAENQRYLYVKRGYVKKVIKKTEQKQKISYNEFAKQKNLSYKDLNLLYKEKYNESLPHHMSSITEEMLVKIKDII